MITVGSMTTNGFQRAGWFCVPASVPGAIVCLVALAFSLTVFSEVDRYSHPVSHAFHGVFPFFSRAFPLLDGIGGRTSLHQGLGLRREDGRHSLPPGNETESNG
jgi:hypothetical protein